MQGTARKFVSRLAAPVLRRAAGSYIAGPEFNDALRIALRLQNMGFGVTTCYWNGDDDSPRKVADAYLQSIASMQGRNFDYLSIKLSALDYSQDLLEEIFSAAKIAGVKIHFDSLGPETADRTFSVLDQMLAKQTNFGVTIPTRWKRSLKDMDWAIERNLSMRIVKGQWADHSDENLDGSFVPAIRHLAGRAAQVNVATHNPAALRESLELLQGTSTRTNVELLYGLPMRRAMAVARQYSTPVRFYIPFGYAWLPYCFSQARKNPRIFLRMLKDSLFTGHDIVPSRLHRS